MLGQWTWQKLGGLALLTAMIVFALSPVRKLVISSPAHNTRKIYPLPANGRFRVLYDARPRRHQVMGEFDIVRNGRLRLLRMIYRKPFPLKKLKTIVPPRAITEDATHVYIRQSIPPFPALHLVLTTSRHQALLMDHRVVTLRDIFPDGSLLDIRTVRRARIFWWWLKWTGIWLGSSHHGSMSLGKIPE